jgi:mRNA-degrading endonuclease RelE of RelBE toxin-antitoxin system
MQPKGSPKKRKAAAPERVSLAYGIDMTKSAEVVYLDLFRKAKEAEKGGDYANAHITTFNMIQDAVKRIIPNDPMNKKYALRGELSNIFRLRKGRLRICWIASSRMRRVCIMFISETLRKEGDASDPYLILQSMIDSGTFDSIFQQFGVRMNRLNLSGRTNKPH